MFITQHFYAAMRSVVLKTGQKLVMCCRNTIGSFKVARVPLNDNTCNIRQAANSLPIHLLQVHLLEEDYQFVSRNILNNLFYLLAAMKPTFHQYTHVPKIKAEHNGRLITQICTQF